MDQAVEVKSARAVADAIYQWARAAGALASGGGQVTRDTPNLLAILGIPQSDTPVAVDEVLRKLKIVGVTADDQASVVGVMLKNKVTATAMRRLPASAGGISILYYGHIGIDTFPPPLPQSANLSGARFGVVGDRFACGGSITAAPVHGVGTMGALVRLADGGLFGLSNNHVTGDCNHTLKGMHILCPAPIDADPNLPAPTAIGRHHSFTRLSSGDPGQVGSQELDAAIFEIVLPEKVSSRQGAAAYDTPTTTTEMSAGMNVMKVGRTTGLTAGRVIGPWASSLAIPYASDHFKSTVHFSGLWTVVSAADDPFSMGGDSGSLVMTENGQFAVGLLLGGIGGASLVMPIDKVLAHFDATLVGGHNV